MQRRIAFIQFTTTTTSFHHLLEPQNETLQGFSLLHNPQRQLIPTNSIRIHARTMSDSEDPIDIADEGGDDLFGDEGDEDALSEIEKAMSDQELASDREDDEPEARRRDDEEEPREFREKLVTEVPLYRHRTPRSKDGGVSRSFRPFPGLTWTDRQLSSCTRSESPTSSSSSRPSTSRPSGSPATGTSSMPSPRTRSPPSCAAATPRRASCRATPTSTAGATGP